MILDDTLLDDLEAKAKQSPRLRMNLNLHDSLDSKAQRLLNALLPGTVIPIVVFYDSMGGAVERILLDSRSGHYGVHIPKGQWHAVEVIEPSVILEVKDGPYMPLQPEDTLD